MAGLNAARARLRRIASHIERDQAYIGVMLDDLTLQGVTDLIACSLHARNIACSCGRIMRICA